MHKYLCNKVFSVLLEQSVESGKVAIWHRWTTICDCIDPSQAPGTGTPEIGGITTFQAQQLVRGLTGIHIAGRTLWRSLHRSIRLATQRGSPHNTINQMSQILAWLTRPLEPKNLTADSRVLNQTLKLPSTKPAAAHLDETSSN